MQQPKPKGVTLTANNYIKLFRAAEQLDKIFTLGEERIIKPSETKEKIRSFITSGDMKIVRGAIPRGDTRHTIHSTKFSLSMSVSSNQDGAQVSVELVRGNTDAALALTQAQEVGRPPFWTLSILDADGDHSFSRLVKNELLTDAENKLIIQDGREHPNDAEAGAIIVKLFDWFAQQPYLS